MIAKILVILVIFFKVTFAVIPVTNKEYASMPILFHLDNYDQCMLWEDEALYCALEFVLEPLDSTNVTETWKIIQNVSTDFWNFKHYNLRHFICVKETCPNVKKSHENDPVLKRALTECYNKKYEHLGLKGSINKLTCEDTNSRYPIDWIDISVAIIVVLYLCLIIYATYYEGKARYESIEIYEKKTNSPNGKLISSFSLVKNWIRLNTITSSPDTEKLRVIQGVRVYNMALVVLEHTVMTFVSVPIANTIFAETVYDNSATLFLSSGPLAVGTFFMLSSFLLTRGLFDHSKDSKGIKPKILMLAFINRIIRLTPILLFVLMFHATWLRHCGNGPNWNNFVGEEYLRCRLNWWTNLLYLNHWIRPEKMCLQVTWYLALDSNYFGIILIIIWILKRYESKFWWILGSLLSFVTILTFWENYVSDYPALLLPTAEMNYDVRITTQNKQWHVQHISFIGNLGGPLVGIGMGYVSHKYRDQRIFHTKLRQLIWHIACYGLGFGIVLIPGYLVLQSSAAHSAFWASMHIALSRPIFGLSIGLAVIGVSDGIGWAARYILEWSPTYILGRLSFSSYLIHMSLVLIRAGRNRGPVHISPFALVTTFLGDLAVTYLAALMLTLLLELPISELQKILIPTKKTEAAKSIAKEK